MNLLHLIFDDDLTSEFTVVKYMETWTKNEYNTNLNFYI